MKKKYFINVKYVVGGKKIRQRLISLNVLSENPKISDIDISRLKKSLPRGMSIDKEEIFQNGSLKATTDILDKSHHRIDYNIHLKSDTNRTINRMIKANKPLRSFRNEVKLSDVPKSKPRSTKPTLSKTVHPHIDLKEMVQFMKPMSHGHSGHNHERGIKGLISKSIHTKLSPRLHVRKPKSSTIDQKQSIVSPKTIEHTIVTVQTPSSTEIGKTLSDHAKSPHIEQVAVSPEHAQPSVHSTPHEQLAAQSSKKGKSTSTKKKD